MAIVPGDLIGTVYRVGNYHAPVGGAAGPYLRTPGGAAFGDQENLHFLVHNGRVKFTVAAGPVAGVRVINFAPVDGAHTGFYLPYRDNNITSVTLSGAGDLFVTDNLSGCSVFIDRLPNNDLVVYHANRQGETYKPSANLADDVTYEREVTIAVKKQFHDNALRNQYPGAVQVGQLFKSTYNRRAKAYNNIQSWAGSNDRFGGGTTVLGFRIGGNWEFWYQTWNSSPTGFQVLDRARFYP